MKVMITGATGFMGPFLIRHCLQAGCTVLGIDRRGSNETLEGATIESCDVRDEARLGEVVSRFRPERIFHLGAKLSHRVDAPAAGNLRNQCRGNH